MRAAVEETIIAAIKRIFFNNFRLRALQTTSADVDVNADERTEGGGSQSSTIAVARTSQVIQEDEESSLLLPQPNTAVVRTARDINTLRLLYLSQALVSAGIFVVTNAYKPATSEEIDKISDQFTLWTNFILGINAAGQIITSFVPAEKLSDRAKFVAKMFVAKMLNNLTMQLQAALLAETAALGSAMWFGQKYLGVKEMPNAEMSKALIALQHLPSSVVTAVSSLVQSKKPSDWFALPSLPFFIMRLLFAVSYILRDQLTETVGYGGFDFNQNGQLNSKELIFMIGTLLGFCLSANLAGYAMWRGLERVGTAARNRFALCCGNNNGSTAQPLASLDTSKNP
ncbi:MAG: hypothetical protein A3C44_03765 [Gammaproteobacteria bacterium RIFCSPHIGHO2_02_FULL_39_13]|nr:MAG: hypothetical protein A3C44_03765 [Gammaproteobacteria bacterium RIFCSPHIGHO2_02_FULL_39_13]OGT50258.1 MAG: hypothetical protein A3E53_00690 [Gammaproteobacteria bacterium RIFCSPHIGHO2_12_FULL_39_24]